MTVNVTCTACEGTPPCGACVAAAQSIAAAGYTVHHSSRYAALRAAATGTYGFDACIVPIAAGERAVADAVGIVLAAKRVALVIDDNSPQPTGLPAHFAVVERHAYVLGALPLAWLTGRGPAAAVDDSPSRTADSLPERSSEDRLRATRRVKTLAVLQRERVAAIDQTPAALDLMSVLDDEVTWARASGLGFGIVLVHLGGLNEHVAHNDPAAGEAARGAAFAILRGASRRGDAIAQNNDDFLILLADGDAEGAAIAARRIAGALAAGAPALPERPRRAKGLAAWGVGVAACPADGLSREVLIARATAELHPIEYWMKDA